MSGFRGVALGVVGLTAMQVLVSSTGAVDRATGALSLVTGGLRRWMDATVPLIPDLRQSAAAAAPANFTTSTLPRAANAAPGSTSSTV